MKTWILDEPTATAEVHAVKPIKPTLNDRIDHLERDIAYSGHISGLLADCEALNDEIAHLREVAMRAQQREVEAVKRYGELEQSNKVLLARLEECRTIRNSLIASFNGKS